MHPRRSVAVALAAALAALLPASAAAAESPTLTVARADLREATHCDASLRNGQAKRAVLLVHGTGATPAEAWEWGQTIALRQRGLGVCTVTLPLRAFADLGTSSEYVAFAARRAARLSQKRIAMIGHSQGGLLVVWTARFWPNVARHTSDVISLAGPVRGTSFASTLCSLGSCAGVAWQMRQGSSFIKALDRKRSPHRTAVTSIGTLQDEIVFPQPASSTVPRGSTTMVQDLCPGHLVDHGLLLGDAAAYALVVDALTHKGPARAERVDRSVCRQLVLPGADLFKASGCAQTIVQLTLGLLNPLTWVSAEPALPAYAR